MPMPSRSRRSTTELQAIADESPSEEADAVFATIGRMIDANNELQKRLALAEKQIAAQAADLRSYETEARTDSLTDLANRRAFDDEMQRRFAEWQRRRTPFTLMILDIDHFKQFNDSHGHPAGDEVLRNVGKVLVKTARQMDLPCRYGGEEFAVILPVDRHPGSPRRRRAISQGDRIGRVVKFEGKSLSVTASIGVACVGDGDDDPARLIRRADEALYKSKEAGRNCGHWHDGTQCLPVVSAMSTRCRSRRRRRREVDRLRRHAIDVRRHPAAAASARAIALAFRFRSCICESTTIRRFASNTANRSPT